MKFELAVSSIGPSEKTNLKDLNHYLRKMKMNRE